jgi:predicted enzyme related to lactoylglutathione lyase
MKLTSVMIGSADSSKLVDYYKKVFGSPVMEEEGPWAGWQLGDGWIVVGPHDGVKGSNSEPGRVMFNLESADVKADFNKLRDAGAIVVKQPYAPEGAPDGGLIATLSDPDGNYFQLMSPM